VLRIDGEVFVNGEKINSRTVRRWTPCHPSDAARRPFWRCAGRSFFLAMLAALVNSGWFFGD
jgi:50S ribosomal protein L16 3-hydroxylase